MFYLKLNKIYIQNNREGKRFLGLIGKDLAQVKIVSFVSTEHIQLPDLDSFLLETNSEKKKSLLSSCVEQVVGSRYIPEPQNIKDKS